MEDKFWDAFTDILDYPFGFYIGGGRGFAPESHRAVEIFLISHPESPEAIKTRAIYDSLTEIGPRLSNDDRVHFVLKITRLFQFWGHMVEYAQPLLDKTLDIANELRHKLDKSQSKSSLQTAITTLTSVKNFRHEYPDYRELRFPRETFSDPTLSQYPTKPFR